jgi:hypothetical protein
LLGAAHDREGLARVAVGYEAIVWGVGDAVAGDDEIGGEKSAGGSVPELEGVVATSGDDEASVGGEGDRPNKLVMTFQGFQQRAAGGVPEDEGLVVASGDDEASVRREGDRKNTTRCMSFEGFQQRAVGGVPNAAAFA